MASDEPSEPRCPLCEVVASKHPDGECESGVEAGRASLQRELDEAKARADKLNGDLVELAGQRDAARRELALAQHDARHWEDAHGAAMARIAELEAANKELFALNLEQLKSFEEIRGRNLGYQNRIASLETKLEYLRDAFEFALMELAEKEETP